MADATRIVHVHLIKYVGGALGMVPLAAGFLDWVVLSAWQDYYRRVTTRQHRFGSMVATSSLLHVALVATVACIVLHIAAVLIRRWFARRSALLGMSRGAWRTLFIGCNIAGIVLGGLIYFMKPPE